MNQSVSRGFSVVLFYNSQGQILLQDRRDICKWGEDYGLFGGSIEAEETPEQCLRRELDEELGLIPTNLVLFKTYTYTRPSTGTIGEAHIYLADLPGTSQLICKEGKMEIRLFKESLNLKYIPGFKERIVELYETLIAEGKTV
ncbi:MAG: NUDIX domain-containing protein [Candidatus Nanoarchaeia archaeon]